VLMLFLPRIQDRGSSSSHFSGLPRLGQAERREVLDCLCELEERDLLSGVGPPAEEKVLLDHEWDDYQKSRNAGSSWEDVEARLLNRPGR
jgi:hypothetical protein